MIHTQISNQSVLNFVTLNDAKRQLNIIDNTDDDIHISDLTKVAMELAEKATNRKLSPCTVTLVMKNVCELQLPYGEVSALTSVQVDGEDIFHSFNTVTGRLSITDSTVTDDTEITVIYNTGYTTPDEVPHTIKMGVKMLISSLFENRENTVTGLSVNDIPLNAVQLFSAEKLDYI